ncbi:MAG: MATE family efflux transporter [Angelakisella sp.]|nr:MATE family efflux transporter [Angelakisella sp.]
MADPKQTDLGTGSVTKLVFKLALPAVTAQVINLLYNIVDRIYIGNMPGVGDVALTGVGVTFPIIMIISAFSAFVGMGGAPLAAIRMGAGDNEGAERILGNGVLMLGVISVTLTILFSLFKDPLLMAFGASENTLPYGSAYLGIYLLGTIFVQFALGLNTFISAQGFATTAMLSVLIGAVTNIVLDPILIFGFNMGVSGAATATVISQAFSAIWVVRFLSSSKSILRIRWKSLRFDRKLAMSMAALGVSPFVMQATESAVQIILNSGLQRYGGDMYVGTMTICLSILQLIIMPAQGFSQGAQPIISYNYGANKPQRVRKAFGVMLTFSLSFSCLGWAVCQFFPHILARIFTPKAELIELTAQVLPIFMFGIFMFGCQMACQSTFLALGQAKVSLFIALLRKIILLIPLAILLPMRFGVLGIYYSEPIADIVAATTTIILFACSIRKILSTEIS